MFRRDVTADLDRLACTYFAVAGEFEPDDYYDINTGVMLMNLKGLREVDALFRAYVRAHLDELVNQAGPGRRTADFSVGNTARCFGIGCLQP